MSEQHAEHVVPYSVYVGVFLALLFFTGLTTYVAYIDLGVFNTVVALLIAGIKMSLVVLFFMHLKYNKGLSRIVIVAAFFWLAIMMSITLADELTRNWTPVVHGWGTIVPLVGRFF
ncbi:MAG TPA: cytochrome C oxidase subunit IV family protein [Candidatus Acidoferrales bacterium]|nr:cytochrome C oxidase subunit IV family protein [Candidatus Acidoferrales bacterium]